MTSLGYEWGENYIAPNTLIFYKTIDGDTKIENIHVIEKGADKIRQFIDVRDYLRAHPEKVKEYEDLKEKLYAQYPDDYPAYREGKFEFLQETEMLAKEWKSSQGF